MGPRLPPAFWGDGMAHAPQTVMQQAALPAWGAFQAPAAAAGAAAAQASPQLKRRRPEDYAEDAQQQWQKRCSLFGDVHQPPAWRRRLDDGSSSPVGAAPQPLPTPQPATALPPLQPQAQQQAQPSLKRAGSSMSDLELSDAEGEGSQQPQRQRQRTGQPEFRLVLPDALPPSIPAGWSPGLPPVPADAFAMVPWCPPLASAQDLQQQQERQRQEQQGRVRRCAALPVMCHGHQLHSQLCLCALGSLLWVCLPAKFSEFAAPLLLLLLRNCFHSCSCSTPLLSSALCAPAG